jgi:peroxiredoxin
MRLSRLGLALAGGSLLLTFTTASAVESASPEMTGVAVGQKAPEFSLKDQNDRQVALGSLLKKGPVALVFFRSAEWWPFCQKQLVQLQSDLKEIEGTGGQLIAISYDSPEVLKGFATKKSITYPLLSDTGSKTIDAYGIRNKEATGRTAGIPYPGTYVIGTDGVIRSKLFLEGYKERASTEAIVEALKKAK